MRVLNFFAFLQTCYASTSGCGPRVLYNSRVRLCANVFGVGIESDGGALTDFRV